MIHAPLIDLLLPRETANAFAPTPVAREDLLYLLECARHAPSARNTQIWHFVPLDDPTLINAAAQACGKPKWAGAPVLIAAQAKEALFKKLHPEQPFLYIDVPIAMTHLSLAARERGLALEWVTTHQEREWIDRLRLDPAKRIVAVGFLGKPHN